MSLSPINNNTEYLKPSMQTVNIMLEDASIFNKVAQKSNEFASNQSKSSLFYKKLELLLKNYKGVTVSDIKQIQQKLGFDGLQFERLDETKIDKIIEHIKETLDKSIVDGIVDLKKYEQFVKAGKDRFDALNKGIVGLLIKKHYLSKEDLKNVNSISEIPDSILQKAVEAFLSDAIKDLKSKSGTITPEQLKKQKEAFQTLLLGTDEKDRARLWDAAKKFFAENDTAKEALTEMFKSYVTPEHLQKFVNKISEEDLEVLGINRDELITALRNVADSENPDAVLNTMAAIYTKIKEFYQKNQEIINNCKQKINEYIEKSGLEKNSALSEEILKTILSEEELKIYRTQNNLTNMMSGTTVGCAEQNIKITQDMQESMQEIPDDFKDDMYERLEAYLKEHKNEFNIKEEDIEKYFNKLTNGEYGATTGHTSEGTSSTSGQNSEYGFSINSPVPQPSITQTELTEKIKNLYPEDNKITVEKNNTDSESVKNQIANIPFLSAGAILDLINNGEIRKMDAMKKIGKDISDATSSAKNLFTNFVDNASKSTQSFFLNGSCGAALIWLAEHIDLDTNKLKTNYDTKIALENIQKRNENNLA